MDMDDNERFNAMKELIEENGYPIPLYCDSCKKHVGFYFKTGSGRWDGKPSEFYCDDCGKKSKDYGKKYLS